MAKMIRVERCSKCPFSTQRGMHIWCLKIHKKVPIDGTIHNKCKLEDVPLTSQAVDICPHCGGIEGEGESGRCPLCGEP